MRTRKRSPKGRRGQAVTQELLGKVEAPERVPSKWRQHYKSLIELRNQLVHRQEDLAKDALEEQPRFSTHMADAGTDTFDRDFALGLLSSEQDALYEIDEAIKRIRNGTFGICEITGKKISSERLTAIPWTRFSAAAEKQLEKEGAVQRARLGARNAVARVEASEPSETEE